MPRGQAALPAVAALVGAALLEHGVRAVLTGGACASLYSDGEYESRDMDFVLTGPVSQRQLDAALGSVGFVRRRDRYVHPELPFFVEFPRGPLAIGDDYRIRPVLRRARRRRMLTLSATDSCRDRLAAFYHWSDRQSLQVAVSIALAQRVDMAGIRRWSVGEGFADRFEEFAAELRRGRARRRRRPR
jgi:hypothetical protein